MTARRAARSLAFIALTAVLTAAAGDVARAETVPSKATVFADAEALFAQAARLIDATPANRTAAAKIPPDDPARLRYNALLSRFGDRDLRLAGPSLGRYVGAELIAFGSYDGFAVELIGSCNRASARAVLHVAREYLDDAEAGSPKMMAADQSDAPGDHTFPPDLHVATDALAAPGLCPPP